MSSGGVNIPVAVTGDDEAKRKLGSVGQAVQSVDAAQANAGKGQNQSNDALKKGGEVLEDFDRKAEKLAKQTLGLVNPQLAQAADMLFDINDGLLKITGTMAAVVAAGAAIGGIIAAYQEWAKIAESIAAAHERVRAAKLEQLEAALPFMSRFAKAAVKAGLGGQGMLEGGAEADAMKRGGEDEDAAIAAALAGQIAGRDGFDREQFLAGLLARGGSVSFDGDQNKNREKIAQILKAGEDPQSAVMRRSYRMLTEDANRQAATESAALPVDPVESRRETLIRELEAKYPQLNAKLKGLLREAMKHDNPWSVEAYEKVFQPEVSWLFRGLSHEEVVQDEKGVVRPTGRLRDDDSGPLENTIEGVPVRQLMAMAQGLKAGLARETGGGQSPAGSVIVNFVTKNVGTEINDAAPQRLHTGADLETPGAP